MTYISVPCNLSVEERQAYFAPEAVAQREAAAAKEELESEHVAQLAQYKLLLGKPGHLHATEFFEARIKELESM